MFGPVPSRLLCDLVQLVRVPQSADDGLQTSFGEHFRVRVANDQSKNVAEAFDAKGDVFSFIDITLPLTGVSCTTF